jgi:hypothetical protein
MKVVPGKRTLSTIIVFGLIAALSSFAWSVRLMSESGWKTTSGKVASMQTSQSNAILIYSFVADGKAYQAAENMGSAERHNREVLAVGQEVSVAYNPNNPSESRLAHGNSFKIACVVLICGIVSLLGTAFAMKLLWTSHKDD